MDDERFIARKLYLNTLKKGAFDKEYMKIGDANVYRVNIIGTVVSKFTSEDGNYSFIIVDDGSDTIRVKAWREDINKLKNVSIGAVVRLIASVREYEQEVYLSPIIIRELDDPNWEIVRKLELRLAGETAKVISIETDDGIIKELIKKFDAGTGADFKVLLKESKLDKEKMVEVLRRLMDAGEVYEPEPNKLKVLE